MTVQDLSGYRVDEMLLDTFDVSWTAGVLPCEESEFEPPLDEIHLDVTYLNSGSFSHIIFIPNSAATAQNDGTYCGARTTTYDS